MRSAKNFFSIEKLQGEMKAKSLGTVRRRICYYSRLRPYISHHPRHRLVLLPRLPRRRGTADTLSPGRRPQRHAHRRVDRGCPHRLGPAHPYRPAALRGPPAPPI